MLPHGDSMLPQFGASAALGPPTITASARVPSKPSQSESMKAGSSGSGLPGAIDGSWGAQSCASGVPSPSLSRAPTGRGAGAASGAAGVVASPAGGASADG